MASRCGDDREIVAEKAGSIESSERRTRPMGGSRPSSSSPSPPSRMDVYHLVMKVRMEEPDRRKAEFAERMTQARLPNMEPVLRQIVAADALH